MAAPRLSRMDLKPAPPLVDARTIERQVKGRFVPVAQCAAVVRARIPVHAAFAV